MRPRELRAQFLEQVEFLRERLPDGTDVLEWLGDPDYPALVEAGVEDLETVAFAHGYLRGAAEALDATIAELFDEYDIRM